MKKAITDKFQSLNFIDWIMSLLFPAFFFLIPLLYKIKMESSIEKNDLYLTWCIGFICWLFVSLEKLKISDLILSIGLMTLSSITFFLVKGDTNSYKTLITVFFSLGIYFFISQSSRLKPIILIALIPVFILQYILGWSQIIKYKAESLMIQGSFSNSGHFANWLAIFVVILISICLKNAIFSRYPIFKIILWGITISCLIMICLTGARAAIIGILAGGISYFLFQKKDATNFKMEKLFTFAMSICLLCVLLLLFISKKDSALGRTTIYKVSSQLIAAYPLTGVGANRLQIHYNLFQAKYFMQQERPQKTQLIASNTFESFNFLLQLMAEYGLIGMVFLCSFTWSLYNETKKTLATNKLAIYRNEIIAALICILFSGLFSNPFHVTPIFILFIVLLAYLRNNDEIIIAPSLNIKKLSFLGKFIVVSISILFCFFGIAQYKAEAIWKKASILARFNSFKQAKVLYEKAYQDLKYDGHFLYNYGAESAEAGYFKESLVILQRAKDYNSYSNLYLYLGIDYLNEKDFIAAEQALLKSLDILPSGLMAKYYLIKLYLDSGQKNKAKKWLTYTLSYPGKVNNELSNSIITELSNLKIN
jgi:O-antigen polymerase